jgi:dTMP kinase
MNGKLIVFEGIEGSGKSTQIQHIQAWLQTGWQKLQAATAFSELVLTREPGGTELGLALRQLLLDHLHHQPLHDRAELLLYMADRSQHVETCLRPLLQAGALILCDRYTDSTVAYQGYGRGLDLGLIYQLNQMATGGLESDLTLWLDVEVEVGLARMQQRGQADRIEQATIEFHQQVRQGFQALADQYPQRMIRIDANPDQESVTQAIQTVLTEHFSVWECEASSRITNI